MSKLQQMLNKKTILGGVAALIVLGGGLIYYNSREKVEVFAADQGTISSTIEESGYTRAAENYDLQAPSSGLVMNIYVSNGQQVKANEAIMQLQDLTLEANLAEVTGDMHAAEATVEEAEANLNIARLNMEEAKNKLDRTSQLLNANAVSQTEYESVVTTYKKYQQSVNLLEAQMSIGNKQLVALQKEQDSLSRKVDELLIKSPINGKILGLPVKKGQLVAGGTVLAVIGTPDKLEAYVEILSSDVVKVKPGQLAAVTYAGSDTGPLNGRVKEIYPQAQEKISALNVRERRVPVIVVLDEKGPLQPGYEVKVSIQCDTHKNVLVIPREALISGADGEDKVRVVSSGRIETRSVETGLKNQLQVEIMKGLKPGELVVRNGSLQIDEKSRVRPIL